MAGNWLQVDCDLPEKPETQRICDATGLPVDLVVGRLVMFWRWVDRHTTSKNVRHVSVATLVRVVGGDETFWKCVEESGWLVVTKDGIEIPGWSKRFSKSAKSRVLDARRKADKRRKNVRLEPDTNRTSTGARVDKSREDKNTEEKKENTTTLPRVRPSESDGFDAFWKVYPRHEAKGSAAKAWKIAVKGLELLPDTGGRENAIALILQAATLFAASPRGQGRYCPHPATWLNGKRFEDDPNEWNRPDDSKQLALTDGKRYNPDAPGDI